ncbi:hypothetical protein AVEN_135158-1 [Araneus ventricosus]|uniref:Uncharacterized protein n=1 Tax=Araneus ventricosus TaxID=182803 RepID=A0A4Y2K628_ARAVE|nr:hypothetical protein AVEN_135158-1 [Araneus ventricosus]
MSHQAERTIGGSHLDAPSDGACNRWLSLICPMRRPVPPIGRTDIFNQAARTTGGSHLDAPSGGAYHRWIALICPTRRRVPQVART